MYIVSWKSNIYTETYAFQILPSSHLFWPGDNGVSVLRSAFGRSGPWLLFCDQTECGTELLEALGALITWVMWLLPLLQVAEDMQLRSITSAKGRLEKKTHTREVQASQKPEAGLLERARISAFVLGCMDGWVFALTAMRSWWVRNAFGFGRWENWKPERLLYSAFAFALEFLQAQRQAGWTMACLTGKHKCEILHVQRIVCASKNVMQNEEHVAMTGGTSEWRTHIQTHHQFD